MQDMLLNDAIQGCRDWAPVKNPEIVTNVTDSHSVRQGMTAAISDQLNTRLYKGPRREIVIRPVRTPHIQQARSPVPATSSMEVIHSPESPSPSNSPEPQNPNSAEDGMDIEQLHKHHQLQRQADMRLAAVVEEVNFEADGLVGVASDTAEVAEEVAEAVMEREHSEVVNTQVSEEAYNGTVSVIQTVEEETSEHVAEDDSEADKSIRQVTEVPKGTPIISRVTPMVVASEVNVGNFVF